MSRTHNIPQLLRLDENQLQELPLNWDGRRLRVLTASGNQLRIGVPRGLGEHPALEWLDLSRNSLVAQARWISLPELRVADFSDNLMEGGFPEGNTPVYPHARAIKLPQQMSMMSCLPCVLVLSYANGSPYMRFRHPYSDFMTSRCNQ